MSDAGYKIRDQEEIHFITATVVQWIDVFSRQMYSDIIVESLKYCQEHKGLKIYAWCIMSNHIHLVCSTNSPHRLSDVIRDFKKFTSSKIIQAIVTNESESRKNWMLWIFKKAGEQNKRNEIYQFWQQGNHPIACNTNELLSTRILYVHENPVRAGIIRFAGDYLYSSGIDYYYDKKGLIDIVYAG
jgi:REP element-mobilizing transposase RayT